MRKIKMTILILLAGVFLTSCAAIKQVQIKKQILNDPSVSEDIKESIRNKKISIGMTKKEVYASWGPYVTWSPCSTKLVTENGVMESWDYTLVGSCSDIVYFKDGKVSGWSQ